MDTAADLVNWGWEYFGGSPRREAKEEDAGAASDTDDEELEDKAAPAAEPEAEPAAAEPAAAEPAAERAPRARARRVSELRKRRDRDMAQTEKERIERRRKDLALQYGGEAGTPMFPVQQRVLEYPPRGEDQEPIDVEESTRYLVDLLTAIQYFATMNYIRDKMSVFAQSNYPASGILDFLQNEAILDGAIARKYE